jgi:hypothetical protein
MPVILRLWHLFAIRTARFIVKDRRFEFKIKKGA